MKFVILLSLVFSCVAFADQKPKVETFADYAMYIGMRKVGQTPEQYEANSKMDLQNLTQYYDYQKIYFTITDPEKSQKTCKIGISKITPKNSDGSKPPVLFFYGNALHSMSTFAKLHRVPNSFIHEGYTVYIMDYPGFGLSECFPQEDIIIVAANKALKVVQADSPKKPIVMGYSLGSGVAAQVARFQDGIDSVVMVSSYAYLWAAIDQFEKKSGIFPFRIGAAHKEGFFNLNWLGSSDLARISVKNRNQYLTLDYVQDIRVPILLLHGTADTDIPIWNSNGLAGLLAHNHQCYSYYKIPGSNHSAIFSKKDPHGGAPYAPQFWDKIYEFLNSSNKCQ